MHNPFTEPHTPGQWLLSSVCWTLACMGGWVLLFMINRHLLNDGGGLLIIMFFWMSHILIWHRALKGGSGFLYSYNVDKPRIWLFGSAWIMLLFIFQVIMLLLGLLVTIGVMMSGGTTNFLKL